MKRSLFVLLIAALTLLIGASVGVGAQDIPCPMPTCPPGTVCTQVCPPVVPGVFTNPEWLKIDYHRVNVEIEDQIARTSVEMKFVNEGNGLAEGTFVFPLPADASVDELIMYINDVPIEARILDATEARQIYDEIVRQYRDPALLEYIGTQTVQANIFPIPPGETRAIEITYTQVLEVDNGLFHYVYPLDVTRLTAQRPVEETSVSVNVVSDDPISNIYSPSHNIAISRAEDDLSFRAGWEASSYQPDQDFSLYYGIASETISVNLLTYRESASEDGFFMLLVQPPLEAEADRVIARDVIVVLDQSGSMSGEKWDQARAAASYVLGNLNPNDRFNAILFSTGWRVFSDQLESPAVAPEAIDWINGMFAEGGTDINGALTTALEMVDPERPTTILFLTDGLPTEGVTDIDEILENVEQVSRPNVRIFAFGVGDDVDTFLLDTLVRENSGTSTYVRPTERIDEEVESLYNKISAPVLSDVALEIDGVRVDSVYPALPLPDLFAGTQLTIVGRYRDGADGVTLTLDGMVGSESQTFIYEDFEFRDRAGGEPFIARLWATRRIGELLNQIRLQGETPELVDSVINLSIRYGIITPYTSFLIEEDDILSQTGRAAAADGFRAQTQAFDMASGAGAVAAADALGAMEEAEAAPMPMTMLPTPSPLATMAANGTGGFVPPDAPTDFDEAQQAPSNPIQTVGGKTFLWQDGVWTDTTFEPDTMTPEEVVFLSDRYFDLIAQFPELAEYFAVGEQVIVVHEGVAYQIVVESAGE